MGVVYPGRIVSARDCFATSLRACHSGALERSDRAIESGEAISAGHVAGVLYSFENVALLGEE